MSDSTPSGERPPSRRSAAVWACFALALAIALVPGDREGASTGAPDGPVAGDGAPEAQLPPPEAGDQRLAGIVHDPSGAPVPGAIVRARREGREESEITAELDAEGRF